MLVFADRGTLGGQLTFLQDDLQLSSTKAGSLASLFSLGFLVASPAAGSYVGLHPDATIRAISLGLLTFTAATALATFAPSYWPFAVARALAGAGEGALVSLGPTLVRCWAPPSRTSAVMGAYVAAMPVGQAIGFGASGKAASVASLGWRSVYGFETLLTVALLALWIGTVRVPRELLLRVEVQPPDEAPLHDTTAPSLASPDAAIVDDAGTQHLLANAPSTSASVRSEWDGFRRATTMGSLFVHPTWWALTLGFAAQLYVIGVLVLFGPDFFAGALKMSPDSAAIAFGAGTVVAGLVGSVVGGVVGDLGRRRGRAHLEYQAWLCAATALIAGPLIFAAIAWAGSSRPLVFGLMFTGEAFIFASLAPLNACTLGVAETRLSSTSMSYSILCAHLLGDVPSPLIAGAAIDAAINAGTPHLDAQRTVLATSSCALVVGTAAWAAAAMLYGDHEAGSVAPKEDGATQRALGQEDTRGMQLGVLFTIGRGRGGWGGGRVGRGGVGGREGGADLL
eukprot:CAMPEP_0170750212 /NCGR_PEP_ID=MMETSP0437-20130122/10806_1 /TAXON_ID=0 /ORGANISM="Sexangularia sp." /LENGTH=509 /DNA_ID=CAMNT_0011089183 /DNA_START=17 /DNA_END=1547 /DNA_ORIENTATION=-